jgi:sugar phosphate isomerase/epimerase
MHVGWRIHPRHRQRETWRRLFGPQAPFSALKAVGIDAAEVPIAENRDMGDWRRVAEELIDAGLLVSLHPYTEGQPYNPLHFAEAVDNAGRRYFTDLTAVAQDLAERQRRDLVLVVHPAASEELVPRTMALHRSIAFFTWLQRHCRRHAPRVRPVAELQAGLLPHEPPGVRIGDGWAELKRLSEVSGCSLCWDLGHAWLNHRHAGVDEHPPSSFINRVAHVHCHDADDADHRPLVHDRVAWRSYLTSLRRAGFDGTVIIEVPLQFVCDAGGREVMRRNVREVRDIFTATRSYRAPNIWS